MPIRLMPIHLTAPSVMPMEEASTLTAPFVLPTEVGIHA
jgi:hypothetical protein